MHDNVAGRSPVYRLLKIGSFHAVVLPASMYHLKGPGIIQVAQRGRHALFNRHDEAVTHSLSHFNPKIPLLGARKSEKCSLSGCPGRRKTFGEYLASPCHGEF